MGAIPYLESLAYHAYEAGLRSEGLHFCRRAGEKALALFAPDAAVYQFSRAIEAGRQLTGSVDPQLFLQRGKAFEILGSFNPSREDYEAALNVSQDSGDMYCTWQALLDLGLLWAAKDYARTGDYCRQALDLARRMNDSTAIGHSLNRLGNWMMNSGQLFEALDLHREALELFETLNDRAGTAETLDLLAMTSNMCGDAAGTVAYYQRAIALLRQLNDRQTLASSLTMLSNYTLDEGQVREAIDITRAIDWRSGEAYALIYLGSLLAYRGEFGPGLSAVRNGLELSQEIDHVQWQAWGYIILGLIYFEILAWGEAYQYFQKGYKLATAVGSEFMSNLAGGFFASTCILMDRLEEAANLLPEIPSGKVVISGFTLVKAAVELTLARHDPQKALAQLNRLELPGEFTGIGSMTYYFGEFAMLHARILMQLNHMEQARTILYKALDLEKAHGVAMGKWRLWMALGNLYQARAEFDQAANCFTSARTAIDRSAELISDHNLRENFRSNALAMLPAVRPPTQPQAAKARYGGLTRRERQVAAVVARGLSNQEIADELVVSIKTVETHLSHIFYKLGFTSRAQIAGWAVERGLASAPKDLDHQ